jgi:hypothetical protein
MMQAISAVTDTADNRIWHMRWLQHRPADMPWYPPCNRNQWRIVASLLWAFDLSEGLARGFGGLLFTSDELSGEA